MAEQRAYINSAHFIVMPVPYSQVWAILNKKVRSRTPKYELSYEIITGLRLRYNMCVTCETIDRQLISFVRAQYETDIELMNRNFMEELERLRRSVSGGAGGAVEGASGPLGPMIAALQRYTVRFINILEIANARLFGIKSNEYALTQLESDVPITSLSEMQQKALPGYAASYFSEKQQYTNDILRSEGLPEVNVFSSPYDIERRIRESGGYLDPITAAEYCKFLEF